MDLMGLVENDPPQKAAAVDYFPLVTKESWCGEYKGLQKPQGFNYHCICGWEGDHAKWLGDHRLCPKCSEDLI